MCSTAVQRIARAIDDLAAQAAAAARGRDAVAGETGPAITRVAELWALLAELDPELARRLPTYEA